MTTLTISPAVSLAPGIDPVVATVSSVRTNASQALSCSASAKPIVPATSSSAMMTSSTASRRIVCLVVVRLTGEDLVGAEELLEQHDARELMGQGHRAERQPVVGARVAVAVTERAADDEADVAPLPAAVLEEAAERDGVHLVTVGVEHRNERALRDAPCHLLILAHLDELESRMTREQALIVLNVVGKRRAQPADGDDDDLHEARY